METLAGWFDLDAGAGAGVVGPLGESGISVPEQVLLYGLVVAGVLLSESVAMAREGRAVSLDLDWPWVGTACLIALIIFPAVWRNIGAMPDAGLITQMGIAAQGGAFWGMLMAGVQKGVRS